MGIVDQGGRFQSVRSDEDYLDMLVQDLDSLSPEEIEALILAMQEVDQGGKSEIYEAVSQALYKRPPVDMVTWLDDPYYCGKFAKELFPELRNDLIELFNGRYTEALLGGGIGGGKTTFAKYAMLRQIYEVSELIDPYETYDVSYSDKIAFPCFAVTEAQAHELVFDKIQKCIEMSPYFQKEFKPVKMSNEAGIVFPNGVWIPPGMSTERRSLGINAFGATLEEANFFKSMKNTNPTRNTPDYAEAIYISIKRRMETRFMKKGRLPGVLLMISSKTSLNSFTERRIKESMNDPKVFVRERSIYELAPERFSGKTFRVAIGNEAKHSKILEDEEPDPEQMQVINVPMEFREAFERDTEGSIRDISGFATTSITPFVTRRDKILECVDKGRVHPFSEYVWCHDRAGKFEWDKLAVKGRDGAWKPIHHPTHQRFISIDFSKSGDATGFAMGCLGPLVEVKKMGADELEMQPSFHIDFVLRVEAATKGEVIQSEVRNLIYELSAHGFWIRQVSSDTFQNVSTLQTLRQKGYMTKEISVDRNPGPYDLLKLVIYENRISYYHYKPLLKEIRELQKDWKTRKVDHPDPKEVPGASKDCSDAVTQLCVQLQEHFMQNPLDAPISQAPQITNLEDDTAWVLENALPVKQEERQDTNYQEDWRVEAQRRLADQQPNNYNSNWRENFQSPFEMG